MPKDEPFERRPTETGIEGDPQTYPGATNIDNNVRSGAPAPQAQLEPARISDEDGGGDPVRAAGIEEAQNDPGKLPPPTAHRADTVVRATGPEARVEMERGNDFRNEASFTKGDNAPTVDRSRMPYTVEQMDEYLAEAPRGVFPDTPGGAGATPISADRNTFINSVTNLGHFPSRQEAEKWSRAVFNALRHRAIEVDDALATEFASVVRVGEAPEVQVEEMMWGGDFVDRYTRMIALLKDWPKREFYQQVAEEAGETPDDPWVDAAVFSFFGALKRTLGDDADRAVGNLGEVQEAWDRA